jgi:hypothetical protein
MSLVATSVTAQQLPTTSAASSPQREPITEDLSHGATFKFKIAPDLPDFTFKLIPAPQAGDEYGNPHTTVREVQVFRSDSKQPVQSLECGFGNSWFRSWPRLHSCWDPLVEPGVLTPGWRNGGCPPHGGD